VFQRKLVEMGEMVSASRGRVRIEFVGGQIGQCRAALGRPV
jgi:hypothetical protein